MQTVEQLQNEALKLEALLSHSDECFHAEIHQMLNELYFEIEYLQNEQE